jgi:hypothetical protein
LVIDTVADMVTVADFITVVFTTDDKSHEILGTIVEPT